MFDHIRLVTYRSRRRYDMPERKLGIRLHVCAEAVSLVAGQLRKARYELLQRRGWVNVDEVIGIDLERVLDSVRMRDDSEDG